MPTLRRRKRAAIDPVEYMPMVRRVARSIHVRINGIIEMDELISIGTQALLEAAERFDPAKGAQFGSYAHTRVRGHILDSLGNTAALPRRAWRRVRRGSLAVYAGPIDPSELEFIEISPDTAAAGDKIASAIDARRLARAVRFLPSRTATIIRLVYFEGRSLTEAARSVGVSTSWASRIKAEGFASLRAQLAVAA